MICQRCSSRRVLSVSAKCGDCCGCSIGDKKTDRYVPQDVLIGKGGWGDYVKFSICLDCGQMQGEFPQPQMKMEQDLTEE